MAIVTRLVRRVFALRARRHAADLAAELDTLRVAAATTIRAEH